MSSTVTEMVAVLMTNLVGSPAMADRLGLAAVEQLRAEHFGLLRGALVSARTSRLSADALPLLLSADDGPA